VQKNGLITITEAAYLLNCSERTIYRYQDNGTLPLVRVGNSRARYTRRRAVMKLRDAA
jgi:DNA binding domain, excisionase family